MNEIVAVSSLPAQFEAADERTHTRFLEFFAANIRNPSTRRAYARPAMDFMTWCADHGVTALPAIQASRHESGGSVRHLRT